MKRKARRVSMNPSRFDQSELLIDLLQSDKIKQIVSLRPHYKSISLCCLYLERKQNVYKATKEEMLKLEKLNSCSNLIGNRKLSLIKTENTCVPNHQTQKDLNFLPSLECKTSKHKVSLPSLNSLKATKQVYSALPNSFGLSK